MRERLRSGAAWTVLDQVASTASNAVALFAVSHLGGTDSINAFAYAFAAYLMVLGVSRALVLDPLLAARRQGLEVADSTGMVLAGTMGAVAAVVVLGAGLVLDRPELLALAAVLPILLMQDGIRHVAYRRLTARTAFACSLAWCVGLVAFLAVPAALFSGGVATGVWGVASGLGVLVGCALLRLRPRTSWVQVREWRREFGAYGTALVAEAALFAVGQQLTVLVVVELANADDGMGVLRGGQTLVGPLPALFTVLNMLAIPRLAQGAEGARLLRWMGIVAIGASAAWLALLAVGGDLVTGLVFGDALRVGLPLLVLLAAQVMVQALLVPLLADLVSRWRAREMVLGRVASLAVGVPVAALFVVTPRVEYLAASLLVQEVAFALVAWLLDRRAGDRNLADAATLRN